MFEPSYPSDTLHMEAQQVVVVAEAGKMSQNEKVGKETGRKQKFVVHFVTGITL